MRTGWKAFTYCMRTAMLPFFFIYNTELLMFGVRKPGKPELETWRAIVAGVEKQAAS